MTVPAFYPLAFFLFAAFPAAGQEGAAVQPTEAAPRYPDSGIFAEKDQATGPNSADKNQPAIPAGEVPAPTPKRGAADYQPLTVRQKLLLSTKESFGPAVLIFDAASAGYDQLTNTPGPWGQGGDAYAERFASEFGITMIDQYSRFALESAFHEDPRYFLSPDRSYGARIKSAIKQTVIHRTDSGGQRFAFANFGGALAAGFASNGWLPNSNNSAGDALETASLLIGRDLAVNLAIEFIPLFRRIH